jgi:hypothetical protein
MRATTTTLFIAGLASTAFGAATKMYDDENWYVPLASHRRPSVLTKGKLQLIFRSGNEVDKVVFNLFSDGDAPFTDNIKSFRTDAVSDVWFGYQDNDGDGCKGDMIGRINDGDCIKVADAGYGCTRLCPQAMGGGNCASTTA